MACACIGETDRALAAHDTRLRGTIVFGREGRPGYEAVTLQVEKVERSGPRPVAMLPTFCPFCGLRYAPEPAGGAS